MILLILMLTCNSGVLNADMTSCHVNAISVCKDFVVKLIMSLALSFLNNLFSTNFITIWEFYVTDLHKVGSFVDSCYADCSNKSWTLDSNISSTILKFNFKQLTTNKDNNKKNSL